MLLVHPRRLLLVQTRGGAHRPGGIKVEVQHKRCDGVCSLMNAASINVLYGI